MNTTKTPGQEEEQRLLKLVNSNSILLSLLYDLDLLPEQLERGSVKWNHMLLIISHWEAGMNAVLDAQPCPHPWTEVETEIRFDQSDTGATIKAKCTKCGKVL